MITIRYHQPNKIITLYHYKKQKYFRGVLYISWGSKLVNPWGLNLEKLSKGFLGLATIILLIMFFPIIYSSAAYHLTALAQVLKPAQKIPTPLDIPISEEFFLEIPKINLTSTIIPNVDSSNEAQYIEKLKNGVAHAKGSYFPGDNGPIVLFSHSTDTLAHILQYNARFYALKDLEIGDPLTIHFKGKTYFYNISEKKIIEPQDLDSVRQANSKLIMTTCYPPGTDWQRLVVFAN